MANTDNQIQISDAWKDMDSIQINISNSWKDVSEAWINVGDSWEQWWVAGVVGGDRGIFAGGSNSSSSKIDTIEYITISTLGDGTDFGNLVRTMRYPSSCSNGSSERGITGWCPEAAYICYYTINSPSNATMFGNGKALNRGYAAGTDNGSNDRGVTGAGYIAGSNLKSIDYITISTTMNALDFGDLTVARRVLGACSNDTNERGVWVGGYTSTQVNTIDYITISTLGNGITFGSLTSNKSGMSATSNGTNERGVIFGYNVTAIEYITINSTGNASSFGNLLFTASNSGAVSNETNERAVVGGQYDTTDTLNYITINSLGNGTDYGDMFQGRSSAGTSNA